MHILFTITLILLQKVMHTLCIIDLDDGTQLTKASLAQDSLIKVKAKCSVSDQDGLSRSYFYIKTLSRRKKNAYESIVKQYDKIVKLLIRRNIIMNQSMLAHSHIKPNYLKKKNMWAFSIVFMFYVPEEEVSETQATLTKLHAKKIKDQPTKSFLDEKMIAMATFAQLKKQVDNKLAKATHGKIVIHKVHDIEIEGLKFENSDVIESQIEQDSNSLDEAIISTKIKDKIKDDLTIIDDCHVQVIFKIGSKLELRDEELSNSSDKAVDRDKRGGDSSSDDSSSGQL